MRDETLIEPFAVNEVFVDGFTDHNVRNGLLTCSGYRIQNAVRVDGEPFKVVVLKIVMPVVALADAIAEATAAVTGETPNGGLVGTAAAANKMLS